MTLKELEKAYMIQIMDRYQNNKTKAAQELGITLKTLYNKLQAYGIIKKRIRPGHDYERNYSEE